VVVGLITGGAVYAKERLNAAKKESEGAYAGDIVVTEADDTKTFTLELSGNPDELDKRSDVTFKVVKRKP
jgi:hypothetical protein